VDAFKNAVTDWHVESGLRGPDLTKGVYEAVLRGIVRGRPVVPKNAAYMPHARHGHEPLPYGAWLKCIQYCESRLDDRRPQHLIGLRRDSVLLRLLSIQCRRQNEVWQMEASCLTDLGPGQGFNWSVQTMKNRQRHSTEIAITEQTAEGVGVGAHLRFFLQVAPREGRLFRRTCNVVGSPWRGWEAPTGLVVRLDKYGLPHEVMEPTGFASGTWNDDLQRILRAACPELDARLYTAHCLRSGGSTAALANGVPVETVQQMLCHRRLDSTLIYTRPGQQELRQAFASVGAARSALGGS
jgi:integrase